MLNLVTAHYAMSGQYHFTTAAKWLSSGCSGVATRDCFLVAAAKQRILRGAMENLTVPLPVDLPAAHCSPEFYQQNLRDSLVVLCCDTPGGDVALVALGAFVGEELHSNVLDPSTRFRGRRDTFNPPSSMLISDANHLLASVHIVTSLLVRDSAVTFASMAADGVTPADLTPQFQDDRLPPQLQLLVPGVQAVLGSPPQLPGTPLYAQQQAALAVQRALAGVQSKRSDAVADDERVQMVSGVLDAMAGGTQFAPGSAALPATRRVKAAARKGRRASQEVRQLLQEAAKNMKGSMHMIYNDYEQLQELHGMQRRLVQLC